MISQAHHPNGTTCPSRQDLSAFHVGDLPADTLEAIATHVGTCEPCLSALEGLDDSPDLLVSELRTPAQPEALSESECRRLAALVADLGNAPAAPDPPAPVDLGQYEVLRELGAGGMGRVFQARHRLMDRVVALKVLRGSWLGRPGAVARFRHEIRALARLDHPHIVRAHDADRAGGLHFLVMEYVAGTDLGRRVREHGPLPVSEACDCVRQAAAGLQHAHEHGVIHRDVKPPNLILTPGGRVKVLDLGLALFAPDGPEAGPVAGTADYMAPEQWDPDGAVDGRADVYGLGCTLYFLLTGRPPFDGPGFTTREQKRQAHAGVPPPPVRSLRPDVPAGLAEALDRMLAKDPAARYASPGEAAEALRPFAAPDGPARRGRVPPRTAALAALAALLAGLALTVSAGSPGPSPPPALRVLEFRVSHHRGPEARPLGELGLTSFAASTDDDVRVHARLSAPAHCYLIALNPDGKDQLCHPPAPPGGATPPARAEALDYPADPDTYFGLTDGGGVQAFVLVAARGPLPPYAAWRAAAGPPPWQRFTADGVWRFDEGRFRRLDVARGDERIRGAPPALQRLADFLRRRTGADAVAAVAFPVGP
jgi:serine/threonine protein kinase